MTQQATESKMSTSSKPRPSLNTFKLLSFDIYGTLIDWETGITTALLSLPPFSSTTISRPALLSSFESHERIIQSANPTEPYTAVLAETFLRLASSSASPNPEPPSDTPLTEAAKTFSTTLPSWPAFPDSLPALHRLSKHQTLVALSNVDRPSLHGTLAGPLNGAPFAATYTAEEIGSYKPDRRNFEYLVERAGKDFGVARHEILHVAQSLFHDHAPAAEVGVWSCWVDRRGVMGGGGEKEVGGGWSWRVGSLEELADLVDDAFREGEGKGRVG